MLFKDRVFKNEYSIFVDKNKINRIEKVWKIINKYRIINENVIYKIKSTITREVCIDLEEIMAKAKTIFVCNSCGYESAKWLGKCPACNEWNSFYEEKIVKDKDGAFISDKKTKSNRPTTLNSVIGKESRKSIYRSR